MIESVKFASIARTIYPKTGIHYMDAIDENGICTILNFGIPTHSNPKLQLIDVPH